MVATSKAMPKGTINGAGWTEMREEEEFKMLRDIHNEPQGSKHVPLQHWNGMDMFNDRIAAANIAVKSQIGLLSQNERKFIYMAEVSDTNLPDLSFMLGFISFNDRSRSVQAIATTMCFVCTNLTFHNLGDDLRQKHLSNVTDGTATIFDAGISKFNEFRDTRMAQINRMKQVEISREMQGNIILDMMHSDVFGKDPIFISNTNKQFEKPVHDEFLDRSVWHFQNAATEEMKKISCASRVKTDKELDRILAPYFA